MRVWIVLTLALTGLTAAACNQPVITVEYEKACTPANDGKNVAVSAFLEARGKVKCETAGYKRMVCGYQLGSNQFSFEAVIELGKGPNQAEQLPYNFRTEDIKVHDNQGNLIDSTRRATFTGEINYYGRDGGGPGCILHVTKIEQ